MWLNMKALRSRTLACLTPQANSNLGRLSSFLRAAGACMRPCSIAMQGCKILDARGPALAAEGSMSVQLRGCQIQVSAVALIGLLHSCPGHKK